MICIDQNTGEKDHNVHMHLRILILHPLYLHL